MTDNKDILLKRFENINCLNRKNMDNAKAHWNNIAKPLHSLGELEEIIIKIAGIQSRENIDISKKLVIIMCADNGIVEENISQAGSEVTAIVTENFAKGIASINHMAKYVGADVLPVDIGVARDIKNKLVLNKKISYGTKNFAKEDAMSKEEALEAIEIGISLVEEYKNKGYTIIGTGEMGIGNTTTSAAICSVLLSLPVETTTGKGAGLSNAGLEHKKYIIRKAVLERAPDKKDVLDVLAKLGGFDIAGLCGVFLGGAIYGIPVVIDGLISSTAALIAYILDNRVRDYMLASHMSKEPAACHIMERLSLKPIIDAGLSLGEGSGACMLFSMLDMAVAVYNANSTFSDIAIDAYEEF